MDKPILFKFVENSNIYVYDIASGRILKISPGHWDELRFLCDIGVNCYRNQKSTNKERSDILQLLDRGFFNRYTNEIGCSSLERYAEILLDRRISDLTLQVTCDCNFKCRYCQYANSNAYERNHSNLYMNENIMVKGLNFLYNHSCDSQIINIGYYGGEPLLNFDIIKKSVIYSKTIFNSKKIRFNMTTNAALLTDRIIDFLAENDFELTLSIDGPEEIQNKHRRFLNTGIGTYHSVYHNLTNLISRQPNYFNAKVKYHPVLMNDDNINTVIDFFKNELSAELDKISPVYAGMSGIDYYQGNRKKILNSDSYTIKFIDKLDSVVKYPESKLTDSFSCINATPAGSCLAGYSKLFVNTRGDLFPCEKVIESSKTQIGNIYTGFDMVAIKRILNSWRIVEEDCLRCWAFKLCSMCAVSSFCGNNDIENKQFKQKNCIIEKQKIADLLRNYVRSKESKII